LGVGEAASCDGTTPFRTTLAVSLPPIEAFKRRACHEPLTCTPATAPLMSADEARTASNTATAGGASLGSSGEVLLASGGTADESGSAFHIGQVDLLHGFDASFSFTIAACPDYCDSADDDDDGYFLGICTGDVVACDDQTAGFAFVFQKEKQVLLPLCVLLPLLSVLMPSLSTHCGRTLLAAGAATLRCRPTSPRCRFSPTASPSTIRPTWRARRTTTSQTPSA